MAMLAQVGEDARFLALLLEALEGALDVFIVMNDDFRQGSVLLLARRIGSQSDRCEDATLRSPERTVKRINPLSS